MAAPVVVSRTPYTDAAGLSHAFAYPTVAAGDLLVLVVAGDGSGAQNMTSSEFTMIAPSAGSTASVGVMWRAADGTEAGNFTIATNGSQELAAVLYRITGAKDPTRIMPLVRTCSTGPSGNPDPPSVTHPFGDGQDYLWIAVSGSDGPSTVTGYPTGYSNGTTAAQGSVSVGSAEKTTAIATEDPGTFTLSGSPAWAATTVGIVSADETFSADYPYVSARTAYAATGAATHNLPYPSGIAAGDLIVAYIAFDNSSTSTSFPVGWTQTTNLGNAGQLWVASAWRAADGTEAGTFAVTGHATQEAAAVVVVVKNVDSTNPPAWGTAAAALNANIDGPSVTTTAGKHLWLVGYGIDLSTRPTTWPTGYVNGQYSFQGTVTAGMVETYEDTATEDPPAIVLEGSQEWVANTVAVLGLAATPGGGGNRMGGDKAIRKPPRKPTPPETGGGNGGGNGGGQGNGNGRPTRPGAGGGGSGGVSPTPVSRRAAPKGWPRRCRNCR